MTRFAKSNNNIYQLVYVSSATKPLELNDIHAIEKVSNINNEKVGVTGVLTYCDCKFMQFLEGQKSNVDNIFSIIRKDRRHHSIDVLRQDFINERQFIDWHMKYTNVDDIHDDHGFLCHKIFDIQSHRLGVYEHALESITILMAFKNSCSEKIYYKR